MSVEFFKCFFAFILLTFLSGCIAESSFRLRDDSRLPKWFEIPEGKKRADVTVTLYYYSMPGGGTAKLVLKDRDGLFAIDKVSGQLRGLKPLQLENASGENDPEYEVMTSEGITDIIGHKGMNDLFYMVDDPAVWKELGVRQY